MRIPLTIFLTAALSAAFQSTQGGTVKTARDKEVEDLIGRMAALPYEIEADGLLMLVGAGKIQKTARPTTLDELFLRVSRTAIKSPLITTLPAFSDTSNVPAAFVSASRLNLDQLSIQTRIILLVKEYDLSHAIELFDTILLEPPSQSCAEPLMPVLDKYYQTLFGLYGARASSPEAKIREGAAHWLGGHLAIAQDAQIAPVATLIVKLSTEPDLFRLAVSRFAQDLSNLNSTYLPYLQSLDGATDALVTLGNRATAIRVPSDSLWRGFATYNRNALAGVRCTEMPSDVVTEKLKKIQTKMAALNLPLESAEDIAALSEIKPKRLDDTKSPYVPFYANSNSPWYAMGLEYQNLRFGPESTRRRFVGKPRPDGLTSFLSLDERKSPEWDERASKHLRQIEAYAKHNDDEAIESFVKVCDLYSAIIAILPNSSTSFPSALSSFVAYLSASPVAKEQPLIWLVKVKLFLRRGTLDEHEQGYERVRAAIRQGGGQLLNTVLDVDRFNPIRGNSNMSTLVDP